MGGSSFNRFIHMYLESLTEDEVNKALDAVEAQLKNRVHGRGPKPPPGSDPKITTKQKLENIWADHGFGKYVSGYFQQFHQSAVEFFRNKSYDDIRKSLPEATRLFGPRAVAFALFVHPDKYRQEVGGEYLARLGDGAFTNTLDVGALEIGTAGQQELLTTEGTEVETERGVCTPDLELRTIQEMIDKLKDMADIPDQVGIEAVSDEWIAQFDDKLRALNEAWIRYKETRSKRIQVISQLSQEVAELTPRLKEVADYCGLPVPETLLREYDLTYRSLTELERIASLTKELSSCCEEVATLRVPARSLSEDRERISCLTRAVDRIRRILDELMRFNSGLTTDQSWEDRKAPESHRDNEPEKGGSKPEVTEGNVDQSGDSGGGGLTAVPNIPGQASGSRNGGDGPQDAGIGEHAPGLVQFPDRCCTPLVTPRKGKEESSRDYEIPETEEETREIRAVHLFRALASNDVATAYWLAREAEEVRDGSEAVPPSWFLLALYCGTTDHCLRSNEAREVLQEIFLLHNRPLDEVSAAFGSRRAAALLTAVAALQPSLLAPETAANAWLMNALGELEGTDIDGLCELLRSVLEFSGAGEPLDLVVLKGDDSPARRSVHMLRCQKDLERWVQEVASARLPYPRAAALLHGFASGRFPEFRNAIDVVLQQRVNDTEIVKEFLNDKLQSRRTISDYVDRCWETLKGRSRPKNPPLEGKTRAQIITKLMDLRGIMQSWVQVASPGSTIPDWQRRRAHQVVDNMLAAWGRLQQSLSNAQTTSTRTGQAEVVGAYPASRETTALGLALTQLNAFFDKIMGNDGSATYLDLSGGSPGHWKELLLRPLLVMSPVPINLDEAGNYDLHSKLLSEGRLVDALAYQRSWEEVLKAHLEAHDFLAARLIVNVMESERSGEQAPPGIDLESIKREISRQQLVAFDGLAQKVDQLRDDLERATLAHALTAGDRARIEGDLNSLAERIRKIGPQMQRIGVLERELEEIRKTMDRMCAERTRSLSDRINSLKRELESTGGAETANLGPSPRSRALGYVKRAEESFDKRDYALADGFLEFAELVMTTGSDDLGLPESSDTVAQLSAVQEFAKVCPELNEALELATKNHHPRAVLDEILRQLELHPKRRSPVAGLTLTDIPGARISEIKTGLEAYYIVKQARPESPGDVTAALPKLLTYLGFLKPSVKLLQHGIASMHFEARMSGESLSPLPEFGSERAGLYDVVVIYGRPSASTIGQILSAYQVETRCPIVLFAGRMTLAQRGEWSAYCWQKQLTALMIDELLLYYLASQRGSRIPAAVSCGVAWGYANPYRHSGPIPPELFKGREAMVRKLGEPKGSCVVYGGRQLGKSVLLRTVQRLYHDPNRRTFVWCHDIKNIGDAKGLEVTLLWKALTDWLRESGILPKNVRDVPDPYKLEQLILSRFQEEPSLRVLILLDEADNFLDYDSKQEFKNVHWFKRLMDQTGRRFKVVFCGLHSVQRFYEWRNHLFTDDPIVVTPLKPVEARKLVIEPMSALGFQFDAENEDAVLRILCYTNYHPALIQQFCHELVNVVRGQEDRPPYRITMEHVEQVYGREDVRRVMRERFEWTIGLDIRYQAIVYAMIYEQFNDLDGFRREFSPKEVLECVRYWWPEGFNSVSEQQVRALLEELIGLGVLIKREGGKYRLRNGNVVRALGSEEDIEDRLLQISATPPGRDAEGATRWLLPPSGSLPPERAPLTDAQVENILQRRPGVALVFGTEALGLDKVPGALRAALAKYFEGSLDQGHQCMDVPEKYAKAPSDISAYLLRQARSSRPGYYIYYSSVGSLVDRDHIGQAVSVVAGDLAQVARRPQVIRWVALFDAEDIWRWYQTPKEEQDVAASQVASIVSLTRWTEENISDALDDIEALNSTYARQRVMEVTGGWPWLWKELRDKILASRQSRGRGPMDSIGAANELEQELSPGRGTLAVRFRQALGVDTVPYGSDVVRVVKEIGGISWDELPDIAACDGVLQKVPGEQVMRIAEALVCMGILDKTTSSLVAEPVAAKVIVR